METRLKPNEHAMLPIPLRTFTRSGGTLSADISDIDATCWMNRLYNDACDVGLAIRSETTGRVERFYHTNEERDREGDIVAWHFAATDLKCPIQRVVVFND